MHWFDYSVIRYLPNAKRGEIINLGIVVFRASGVDIKILNSAAKIRMFDNSTNISELLKLESTISEICSLSKEPDEQFELLNSFGSGMFVSNKYSFSIENLSHYDKKISLIFNELVKPYAYRGNVKNHSRLYTKLKKRFKSLDLLAKDESDIYNHKIVPSYTIDKSSGLSADFMFKNGRYHMTEVIDFNVNDNQAKFKETTLKVMSFIEGKRHISSNLGCYLVYSATVEKENEVSAHINLASDYSDKIYNIASKDDESSYYQMLSDLTGTQFKW